MLHVAPNPSFLIISWFFFRRYMLQGYEGNNSARREDVEAVVRMLGDRQLLLVAAAEMLMIHGARRQPALLGPGGGEEGKVER
jgi:hypothetical protein